MKKAICRRWIRKPMLGTAKQQPWRYQGNNLTITKALLNVIADAKTKVYGDADPSLTYQVTLTW